MWLADLVGDRADDLRELLLHPLVDRLADPRGHVVPEPRVLAFHRPLDDLADVAPGALEDVLGDLLGLELVVELLRAAELGDPLVDRDRAHLRGARGDDPLPADPALHHPRDLLDPARQEPRQLSQQRHPRAPEPDRLEQHDHAGPVGHVADRPREDRHREDADQVDLLHPVARYPRGVTKDGRRILAIAAAFVAVLLLPSAASAEIDTETFTTGPITVGGYQVKQEILGAQAPKIDGHIVAMEADIVDANGEPIPIQRLMLHHLAFLNFNERDRLCSNYQLWDGSTVELRARALLRGGRGAAASSSSRPDTGTSRRSRTTGGSRTWS